MTRGVKICGLTRPEDVEAAILHGADMLGFIVECPSKRRLSVDLATKLSLPAQNIIPRVAVTVNADDVLLARIIHQMQPDYIQLHGDESPDRVNEIKRKLKAKIIKVAAISDAADMASAQSFYEAADLMLFDAKPPKGSDVRGGHGIRIDWSLFQGARLPETYLLAGGLNPDNVTEAIAATHAPILDVSSGVEAAPGVKDHAKIQAFIEAAKHG